jgi:hypothetical protein
MCWQSQTQPNSFLKVEIAHGDYPGFVREQRKKRNTSISENGIVSEEAVRQLDTAMLDRRGLQSKFWTALIDSLGEM